MNNLQNIAGQNATLKKELSKHGLAHLDDAILKGGYRVVRTIKERNAIDCCHRKLGMKVMVIGQDYTFKEYTLQGQDPCTGEEWVLDEVGTTIGTLDDGDITLLDDYSSLNVTQVIETQQDLNQVLTQLLLSVLAAPTVDKHYTHEQTLPSDHWIIKHNLGKRPSVTVVDSANTVLLCPYAYVDDDEIHIHFNGAFSGKAYLN